LALPILNPLIGYQFVKELNKLCYDMFLKVKNQIAPGYLGDCFVSQESVHSYCTRLSKKGGYCLPNVEGSWSKSLSFIGAKLWNSLPTCITEINKFHRFKVAIKTHFLSNKL
jgi:hypothetical protein